MHHHIHTQAVVHELMAEKLPQLNAHLQEYSIDVTLVTFNWFLTLYIDALPTEVSITSSPFEKPNRYTIYIAIL